MGLVLSDLLRGIIAASDPELPVAVYSWDVRSNTEGGPSSDYAD